MASWEKQSERLLKARYKLDNGTTWNYPPAYTGASLRGYEIADPSGFTVIQNTVPVIRVNINLVSRNPNLEYADDFGEELQYGLKYEVDIIVTPLIVGGATDAGVSEDESMFEFIQRFHLAPIKEIGYIEGRAERLVDSDSVGLHYDSTGTVLDALPALHPTTIRVVNSQAKLDCNTASGHRKIVLHLRSSNTVPLASLPKYYYTGS